ncbi:MAG: hypothetical protein H0X62_12945, partial [Bacteroidetes bacterium]|nr:hypothetical protein [Bacteroidota bacterium]
LKGFDFNPEKAREYLKAAGFPGGKGFPEINFTANNGGGGKHDLIAAAISKMLEENLGIKINMLSLPFKDYLLAVESGKSDFFSASWAADYPSPESFLNILNSKHLRKDSVESHYLNAPRYVNALYDSIVRLGLKEPNIQAKNKLFMRAEQMAVDDAAIMPIVYQINSRILQPYVRNFPVNAMECRDFSRVWIDKDAFEKFKGK